MGKQKEKKGKKKAVSKIIISILTPILIVTMIAAFFFSIIDGIIKIILEIIAAIFQAIADFWRDPAAWVSEKWATFKNWVSRELHIGSEFNEEAVEERRLKPYIVIELTEFENMKNNLENVINRNVAGLDDLMLKKMMLTNYRGTYLSDTTILIELTESEIAQVDSEGAYPFHTTEGNEDEGKGVNGVTYLATKGVVRIENSGDRLIFYDEATLREIYNKHYKNVTNEDYAKSTWRYLRKCYTYGENGIKKFIKTEDKHTNTWEHKNSGRKINITNDESSYEQLVNVNFFDEISEYVVPMDFMINLMEVTGSKDFINSFMEMIGNETKVVIDLEDIDSSTKTKIVNKSTDTTTVTGTKPSLEYTVQVMDINLADGSGYTKEVRDGKFCVKDASGNVHIIDESKFIIEARDAVYDAKALADLHIIYNGIKVEGLSILIQAYKNGVKRLWDVPEDTSEKWIDESYFTLAADGRFIDWAICYERSGKAWS